MVKYIIKFILYNFNYTEIIKSAIIQQNNYSFNASTTLRTLSICKDPNYISKDENNILEVYVTKQYREIKSMKESKIQRLLNYIL